MLSPESIISSFQQVLRERHCSRATSLLFTAWLTRLSSATIQRNELCRHKSCPIRAKAWKKCGKTSESVYGERMYFFPRTVRQKTQNSGATLCCIGLFHSAWP